MASIGVPDVDVGQMFAGSMTLNGVEDVGVGVGSRLLGELRRLGLSGALGQTTCVAAFIGVTRPARGPHEE